MKVLNISLKKVCFLCAVFVLTLALGTGMNRALASQNIQSLLTGWFDTKKDASIRQMDQEITSEKERLMVELREAIKIDMQRADEELAQFTTDETALRLSMLESYAEELIKDLAIDATTEKAEVIANLDAALVKAKAQLDSSITASSSVPTPTRSDVKDTTPAVNDKEDSTDSDGHAETDPQEFIETEEEVTEADN